MPIGLHHEKPKLFLQKRTSPEVVEPLRPSGDVPFCGAGYSLSMQLVQIGEVREKTVLDLVQEMAARQFAEIEHLKQLSSLKQRSKRSIRSRQRCKSAAHAA